MTRSREHNKFYYKIPDKKCQWIPRNIDKKYAIGPAAEKHPEFIPPSAFPARQAAR
jgi:hypothetical protein